MSRVYTNEEVRDLLINHIKGLVAWWAAEDRVSTAEERLHGLAHSILAVLDGASFELPMFLIIPQPHPEDKDYHKSKGQNWFRPNPISEHIADKYALQQLHEHYHQGG